jgi:hypothetical protein
LLMRLKTNIVKVYIYEKNNFLYIARMNEEWAISSKRATSFSIITRSMEIG